MNGTWKKNINKMFWKMSPIYAMFWLIPIRPWFLVNNIFFFTYRKINFGDKFDKGRIIMLPRVNTFLFLFRSFFFEIFRNSEYLYNFYQNQNFRRSNNWKGLFYTAILYVRNMFFRRICSPIELYIRVKSIL